MDKPIIARQLERWEQQLRNLFLRPFGNEYYGAICLGPPGSGKSYAVRKIAAECGVSLTDIPVGTTLHGMEAAFRKNPWGIFWFDDFDDWLRDLEIINFLKKALEPSGDRLIGALNRDTFHRCPPSPFFGRVVISSNENSKAIPPRLRPHVAALEDRVERCDISWDSADRLTYIDWLVCDGDYFRSVPYLLDQKMGHQPLSLSKVTEILRFMHDHATRMEPSLRRLNAVARERVRDPDHWQDNMLINAPPPKQWSPPPPPMPTIRSSVQRAGTTTIAPRGKKAKRDAERVAEHRESAIVTNTLPDQTSIKSCRRHRSASTARRARKRASEAAELRGLVINIINNGWDGRGRVFSGDFSSLLANLKSLRVLRRMAEMDAAALHNHFAGRLPDRANMIGQIVTGPI
jgi:hypothetical protein